MIKALILFSENYSQPKIEFLGCDTQEHNNHRGDATVYPSLDIGALRLAADDPYTQEHPKSRGLQQSVREKERDLGC